MSAAAKVPHKVHDGMVIDTTLNDCIDLQTVETGIACGLNAFKHLGYAAPVPRHRGKDIFVKAVQTDGNSPQSGAGEILRHLWQQNSIGNQGKIPDARDTGKTFD